jgi:5-methylthioribose kinase
VDRENYLFGMTAAPQGAAVWKEVLLAGMTEPAVARQAGLVLGLLHERTAQKPGFFEKPGFSGQDAGVDLGDRTVFVQLRVEPFYQRVRERRPEVAEAVTPLIDQLMTTCEAVCHGDFSPKNLLVHPPPAKGAFTLVDYETVHVGDPTMDLGFFLSHLVLKAVKNSPRRQDYFALTHAFWLGYGAVVRFQRLEELMRRGIQHFAVCALARVDGTSPVDYLPEETKREVVRQIGRRILWDAPRAWPDVVRMIETEVGSHEG